MTKTIAVIDADVLAYRAAAVKGELYASTV